MTMASAAPAFRGSMPLPACGECCIWSTANPTSARAAFSPSDADADCSPKCHPDGGLGGAPISSAACRRSVSPGGSRLHSRNYRLLLLLIAVFLPAAPAASNGTASQRVRASSQLRRHKGQPPPPPASFGMAVLQARYPQHPWHLPVKPSDTPRGYTRGVRFVRARSDEDLMSFYDENLELDLAPWLRRNRTRITVSELLRWVDGLPFKASHRVLIMKGGRLGILKQRGGSVLKCERPCDPVLDSLIADLRAWLAAARANASEPPWPDVVFFINVADTSLCQSWEAAQAEAEAAQAARAEEDSRAGQELSWQQGRQQQAGGGASVRGLRSDAGEVEESGGASGSGADPGTEWRARRQRRRGGSPYGPCPVPVLSLIKEWGKRKDEDILVPITVGMKQLERAPLSYFPLDQKIDAAGFRGREYCHTKHAAYAGDTCSRTYFAAMSAFNSEWSRFINVGFVDNYTTRGPDGAERVIPGVGFVPTQEVARFRYVLALDGITASSRLAQLLSFNSVVLKQTSPWIEWYYRSLVPGTHYISFWNHHRTDILQAIKYLRHKRVYLQDVSVNAQAFAYRYLSPDARRLYWRRALAKYRSLFADMDEFVSSQVIPDSE